MGEPFAAFFHGCGGYSGGSHCRAEPTWCGLVHYPYPVPGELCRGFACGEHVHQLDVARPLTDSDRRELDARRAHHRAVIDGPKPDVPVEPLARGEPARRMLAQARAWAADHDEYRSHDPI